MKVGSVSALLAMSLIFSVQNSTARAEIAVAVDQGAPQQSSLTLKVKRQARFQVR